MRALCSRVGTGLALLMLSACTATSSEPVHPAAETGATPKAPTASTAPVLSHREVARRCGPQIRSHRGEHGYRGIMGARLGVAFDRDYRVGDIVRLVDTRRLPVDVMGPPQFHLLLCKIPAAGHLQDPVPATAFSLPPDGAAELAMLCAEVYDIPSPRHDTKLPPPDLRTARLVARSRGQGVVAALFVLDGRGYGCLVTPALAAIAYSVRSTPQTRYTTCFLPTAVPQPGSPDDYTLVFSTWGKVPAGAATLDFIRTDGTRASSPVTDDGYYAMAVADSAGKLSTATRYEFVAPDGTVLGSGPALRE